MLTFQVADMSCGHCVAAVTQAVKSADPLATVDINLNTHTVTVEGATNADKIQQAIVDAGYTPVKQA